MRSCVHIINTRMTHKLLAKIYRMHTSLVHTSVKLKLSRTVFFTCWFVRGRIKGKNGTIYAIKHQVYCIANTAQWLANTVLLF